MLSVLLQTEAPHVFDEYLPEITIDDISELKEAVPELSTVLRSVLVTLKVPVTTAADILIFFFFFNFHQKIEVHLWL